MSVERGAATSVRAKEPTKRPGRFPKPKDIAPSSRNGRTTKKAHVEDRKTKNDEQRELTKKKQEEEYSNAEVSCG
ncbi:hypothetical protein U1Q18_026343 [Sarracenia purpurea var. burkii]